MAKLYGADERPAQGRVAWYLERRKRCHEQIWLLAQAVVAADTEVVLELGLVRRDERLAFYENVAGIPMSVYLLEAPRDERRVRVNRRNLEMGETFAMHVPSDIFEYASDLWQTPDSDEICAYNVCPVEPITESDGSLRWLYAVDSR